MRTDASSVWSYRPLKIIQSSQFEIPDWSFGCREMFLSLKEAFKTFKKCFFEVLCKKYATPVKKITPRKFLVNPLQFKTILENE